MPTCRIPFCDKKCNNDKNRHFFTLPKDETLSKKWHHVLGPYFPNNRLTKTTRICNLHFHPQDIETKFKHVIDGRVIEIDRERARLIGNAVPIYNLPTEEEMLTKRDESRGCPFKNNSISGETSITNNSVDDADICEQLIDSPTVTLDAIKSEEVEDTNPLQLPVSPLQRSTIAPIYMPCDFDTIYASCDIKLPPLWAIHRCPDKTKIVYTYLDLRKMSATKFVSIDKDYILCVIIDGHKITEELFQPQDQDTIKAITKILEFIDQT